VADDEAVLVWCEALGWVREVKFGQWVVYAEAGQADAVSGVLSGGVEEAFGKFLVQALGKEVLQAGGGALGGGIVIQKLGVGGGNDFVSDEGGAVLSSKR
jgi:hypothetical protein